MMLGLERVLLLKLLKLGFANGFVNDFVDNFADNSGHDSEGDFVGDFEDDFEDDFVDDSVGDFVNDLFDESLNYSAEDFVVVIDWVGYFDVGEAVGVDVKALWDSLFEVRNHE